ncbi:unnamed protein product, partial [Timema podura]|nr:unnamed protein product [Timema podura]
MSTWLRPMMTTTSTPGYNEYPSAFSTKDLQQDQVFQQAVRSSYGRRPTPLAQMTSKPGTAMRLGTSSG